MSNSPLPQPAPAVDDNPCLDMLRAYASLLANGPAGRARALELSLAKPVACAQSPQDIPEPQRSALLRALSDHKPRKKLCHDNAWRICAFVGSPFHIVSGYACSIIPVEHSWLRVDTPGGPIDFDPTDWGLFGGQAFSHHVEIFSMDSQQALARASETGHSGPWRQEALMELLELGEAPKNPTEPPTPPRAATPRPTPRPGKRKSP